MGSLRKRKVGKFIEWRDGWVHIKLADRKSIFCHKSPPPPNPAWTQSVHLDAPSQRHGQPPVSGTADPGVVKQDKSSRGFVDTTKTRLGPQRVRMSSGERPIGAAKGKQSNTEALCQTLPPCPATPCPSPGGGGGVTWSTEKCLLQLTVLLCG